MGRVRVGGGDDDDDDENGPKGHVWCHLGLFSRDIYSFRYSHDIEYHHDPEIPLLTQILYYEGSWDSCEWEDSACPITWYSYLTARP